MQLIFSKRFRKYVFFYKLISASLRHVLRNKTYMLDFKTWMK